MAYLFKTFYELINQKPIEDSFQETLKKETRNIIKAIDQELFGTRRQEEAEFYIQKIELAITNHEASIQDEINANDSISRARLLQCGLDVLDTIRYHLEKSYSVYRKDKEVVSKRMLNGLLENLQQREKDLATLLVKSGINEKLIDIILTPMRSILSNREADIDTHRIDYLCSMSDDLTEFLESNASVDDQQLLQYLYILNFNNISLLCYICEHYDNLKSQIDDERSLLDHLYESKKKLNLSPLSQRRPYNPNMSDLKNQVQLWIQEEIDNIKKTLKSKSKDFKRVNGSKLKFNCSVETISALFRLLLDAGITDSGANQTVRWINQNISSKNQPHISQQSIQRKFFEKHSNKEPLKEIVIQLLNHLNHK